MDTFYTFNMHLLTNFRWYNSKGLFFLDTFFLQNQLEMWILGGGYDVALLPLVPLVMKIRHANKG